MTREILLKCEALGETDHENVLQKAFEFIQQLYSVETFQTTKGI